MYSDHNHDHHHAHAHGVAGHSHAPKNFGPVFLIGVGLNLLIVGLQAGFGIKSHSLALLADAGHNFGDALGLVLAWTASYLVKMKATERYTYGWRRTSVLAALANAILLLMAVGAITWEAIEHLGNPQPTAGITVIWVALAGIAINGIVAFMFFSGRKDDLNIRGAFLHMAADAAVSGGVVIAGILIVFTGWRWLDPVASLAINAVIVWSTWALLRESFNLAIDGVPAGIKLKDVKRFIESQPGVSAVHDLHVWAMSTTETALTVHVVRSQTVENDVFLVCLADELHQRFDIGHSTVQIEYGNGHRACKLEPDEVV